MSMVVEVVTWWFKLLVAIKVIVVVSGGGSGDSIGGDEVTWRGVVPVVTLLV